MIGWTAVIFATQAWLGETPAQKAASSTPGYFSIGMAVLSLGVVRTRTSIDLAGNDIHLEKSG